jgi:hypothetical protein
VGAFYWERHPGWPFATLIAVAATYCSPEAYDGAYDDLISRAWAPEPDDKEIRAFTAELQQALADPGRLPGDELFDAVDYGDGSDEAFLRRLWYDLYSDQPGAGASRHRAIDAAYYEDRAGRLYGLLIGLEDRLDREDARHGKPPRSPRSATAPAALLNPAVILAALKRRATGLAGSWPGVDWQTGGGALEVAVEHDCQRTLPVMMSLGVGQRGALPRCAGLP